MFNSDKTIKQAITSLKNQTWTNWEAICIDDGSTDGTSEIVQKIADKDHRIKYVYQNNSGASAARNRGLELAQGDFIAFMDSDDNCNENFLQHSINRLNATNSDIVVFGYSSMIQNQVFNETIPSTDTTNANFGMLLSENLISVLYNKLYSANSVKNNRFYQTTIGEDYLFNLSLLQEKPKIATLSENLYYYNLDTEGSLYKTYASDRNEVLRKEFQYVKTFIQNDDQGKNSDINMIIEFKLHNLSGVVMNLFRDDTPLKMNEKSKILKQEFNYYDVSYVMILKSSKLTNLEKVKLLLAKMDLITLLNFMYKIKKEHRKV